MWTIEWGKNQNQDVKIPGTVSNIAQKSLLNVTRTKNYDTCLNFLPPRILRSSSLHLESGTPRHPPLSPLGFFLTGTRIVFTKRRTQRYRLFKGRTERFTVFPPFSRVSTVVQTKLGFKSSVFASVEDTHRDAYFFNVLSNQS